MTPHEQSVALCICGDLQCDIPEGYCHCRCGKKTDVASRTYAKAGIMKGRHYRFFRGHFCRTRLSVEKGPFIGSNGYPYCQIALSQGQIARVSPRVYDEINSMIWAATWKKGTNSFYAVTHEVGLDGKSRAVYMHRKILGLSSGSREKGDHINTADTLDNTDENIRVASQRQQMQNRRKSRNNTSGFKGVSKYKPNGKYRARVYVGGKTLYLGYFFTPEEAYAAYCKYATENYGEFARLA